jgi:hypothetical protein
MAELLAAEGLNASDVRVFPPQIRTAFAARLAAAIGLPVERLVLLSEEGVTTSSLAYTFRHAREAGRVRPGDVGRSSRSPAA